MPLKPSQDEQDEYESFARAALGKKAADPPKKKAAPVDTVRLKDDMDADKRTAMRLTDMGRDTRPSRASTDYDRAADAMVERHDARADTLQKARKGTLPVRKNK